MARRRLLAIFGALGLGIGLISSGIAAQAETEPPTLDALIWTWSWSTQNVCNSNSGTATLTGGVCTIDQTGPTSEDNVAICLQNNTTVQSCLITQAQDPTSTEDNRAIVVQRRTQSGNASENATQRAQITQHNGLGRNDVWDLQIVTQVTSIADNTNTQTQVARQFDAIDQTAVSGGQKVLLGQLSTQQENSTTATQQQFSDQDVSDFLHHINQTSTGISEIGVGQAQIQTATGSGSQTQVVDPRCCSNQRGNPGDKFRIAQFVFQKNHAASTDDPQDATSLAECHTDGNCTTSQSTTNNTSSTSNSCSGTDCVAAVHCGSSVEGGCTKTSVQCTVECSVPPTVCPPFACSSAANFSRGYWAMAAGDRNIALIPARSAPRTPLLT
jgi:hypothetical protein